MPRGPRKIEDDVRADIAADRPVRVPALAREANRSNAALYEAIRRGEIAADKVGRAIRVPAREAARLLGMQAAA